MNNEEMFMTILNRMDTMGTSFSKLDSRMDRLEGKVDKLDSRMDKLEGRMDRLEDKVDNLEGKVDKLEGRMDKLEDKVESLESNMNLEFQAVRTEMEVVDKSLKKEINILSIKVDRLLFTKDVEGYDELKVRVDVLEKGYQDLKEKIV